MPNLLKSQSSIPIVALHRSKALTLLVLCLVGSWTLCLNFAGSLAFAEDAFVGDVDFNTQVRPILSDRCFHCHGPDAENQESSFRANTKESLFADLGGYFAVVAGDLDASEVHLRIHSDDSDAVMPPPDSNRSLTENEKAILDAWIKQGAPYEGHWSFEIPLRERVDTADFVARATQAGWSTDTIHNWSSNPIDYFVGQRLIDKQLQPNAPASPELLIRRAAMSLTGLLPKDSLRQKVLTSDVSNNDAFEQQYRAAVDQMLGSTAYAERQALRWLDAARYADTDGFQNDGERTNWPWRDWVINAFRDNMPFDQFTIEQLAGDMLPDATDSQRLASTFNRNHRQNAEGGALAEEFFVENVIDRVETTSTVWLGLTFGCARCHDHKYDPLSQKEFFQLYSYFNNIGEAGTGPGVRALPTMIAASPLQDCPPHLIDSFRSAEKQLEDAKRGESKRRDAWILKTHHALLEAEKQNAIATIASATLLDRGQIEIREDDSLNFDSHGKGKSRYQFKVMTGTRTIKHVSLFALTERGYTQPNRLSRSVNGNFVLTDVAVLHESKPAKIQSATASFEQKGYPASSSIDDNASSGWAISGRTDEREERDTSRGEWLRLELETPIKANDGETLEISLAFESGFANHAIGRLQVSFSDPSITQPKKTELKLPSVLDDGLIAILKKPAGKRSSKETRSLSDVFPRVDQQLIAANTRRRNILSAMSSGGYDWAVVMIMKEKEGAPTPAYRLDRGQYDAPDKSEILTRGIPVSLLDTPNTQQPRDRLELARWFVSRDNPLTARVMVNRIWQDHFGIGLVKTAEDFGLQGEAPSHRKLLDWLAIEFIESGWDIAALHRLIVTSAAYRQSSAADRQAYEADPGNRLIARGPRYRLDGFAIRDMALQASGLLNETAGGPPVKPYQPSGLWEVVAARKGTRYTTSDGDDLFRRSLYTYWKRAVNPPRQIIFDAGGREVCNVRVRRTNTPLQALALMNDPTFVEAARQLAQRALSEPSLRAGVVDDRLRQMVRWATALEPDQTMMQILRRNQAFFLKYYSDDPKAAEKLIAIGKSRRDPKLDVVQWAAYSATAHLILNTDEFVSLQ